MPRTSVITLSGLDGAGKSSQARALQAELERLGYDVAIEWIPIASNRSIGALSEAVRVLLRAVRRVPPFRKVARHAENGGSLLAGAEAGTSGTAKRALGLAWTTLLALANALAQRRRALRHAGRSRIVVFDRYTLDSVVILRHLWGGDRRFPAWLIRTLSPRPVCSFLLDVPAETALARKRDQWNLENLRGLAELYRAEAPQLGVRRLDGERPREELTAQILAEITKSLP